MDRLKFIPGNRYARLAYIGLLLFIPLILLIPGWDGFVYSPRSTYSDLVISHYPNALYILDALRQGQFPLWSPMLFAGYPFAADPLSGLWYLPGWIALIFPLPFGFNFNLLIHLFFSGVGMWLFLREKQLDWLPAVGGALAWELMPKVFAHIGAGHITLIYAAAWTPWLLLAEIKSEKTKFPYWGGIILAMIVLADVRWAVYAGLLWLAFSAYQRFSVNKYRGVVEFARWIKHLAITALLAVVISAPLVLPLAEFSSLSTRSMMSVEDNLSFSLSPIQLFGLIAPDFGGYAEFTVYFGGLFLLVAIWMLTHRELRKQAGFWLVVLVCTLLLSLGAVFPPNQWLARLPGMDLLRVPSRFMIIFGFAAAVMTALFLQSNPRGFESRAHFWGNLLSAGLAMFSWVIVIGLGLISASPPWQNLWGAAFLTAGVITLFVESRVKIPLFYFQVCFLLILLLDIGSVAKSNFTYIDKQIVSDERADAAGLTSDVEPIRIYSPSYSVPQQVAAQYKLETINGIDPLQLKNFIQFFSEASGVPYQKYSVTVPPFENGDIVLGNQQFTIDAQLMGLLNVKYIVSSFNIDSPDLTFQEKIQGQNIYINQDFRPRAWIQPEQEKFDSYSSAVSISHYSPNSITLEGMGPGYLVLSEAAYSGWEVRIDGKPLELLTIHSLLRGVYLQPGNHQVIFTFRPVLLYLSLAAAVLGWLWAFYQIWSLGRKI